ncbi:MAG: hypothetical protein JOZ65_02945, partial [Chloroflexi bacterium]|nr:hypothetical protein [Chloroflexota bacterium]
MSAGLLTTGFGIVESQVFGQGLWSIDLAANFGAYAAAGLIGQISAVLVFRRFWHSAIVGFLVACVVITCGVPAAAAAAFVLVGSLAAADIVFGAAVARLTDSGSLRTPLCMLLGLAM